MPAQPAGSENELSLLEALEDSPETTQADLAAQVGVAVGTVNWYLKRWSKKGYVKVSRMGRWKWSYLLTPEGISHKATLATKYVDASMTLYRRTRADAKQLLTGVKAMGIDEVHIDGSDEIADICRLTCLEMGLKDVPPAEMDDATPTIQVVGTRLELIHPSGDEQVQQSAETSVSEGRQKNPHRNRQLL